MIAKSIHTLDVNKTLDLDNIVLFCPQNVNSIYEYMLLDSTTNKYCGVVDYDVIAGYCCMIFAYGDSIELFTDNSSSNKRIEIYLNGKKTGHFEEELSSQKKWSKPDIKIFIKDQFFGHTLKISNKNPQIVLKLANGTDVPIYLSMHSTFNQFVSVIGRLLFINRSKPKFPEFLIPKEINSNKTDQISKYIVIAASIYLRTMIYELDFV
jgi:hypothetical protein